MTEEIINSSHQVVIDKFSDACLKLFGIRPMQDDKLILDAFICFKTYIKTFKKLDHNAKWHQQFIDTVVRVKIDALSKRIIRKYGTHQRYLDCVQERSSKSKETNGSSC